MSATASTARIAGWVVESHLTASGATSLVAFAAISTVPMRAGV